MEVLGSAEWSNLSEDYEGMADVSSVELVLDGGKTFLVLRFNTDFERREEVVPGVPFDASRLNQDYPVCTDSRYDVECVAEDLGMTLV